MIYADSRIDFTRSVNGNPEIYVDGYRLDPEDSQRVENRSLTGFEWGYGGGGPAQTALALLLETGLSARSALRLHQRFKRDKVSVLDLETWMIGAEILDWIKDTWRGELEDRPLMYKPVDANEMIRWENGIGG